MSSSRLTLVQREDMLMRISDSFIAYRYTSLSLKESTEISSAMADTPVTLVPKSVDVTVWAHISCTFMKSCLVRNFKEAMTDSHREAESNLDPICQLH